MWQRHRITWKGGYHTEKFVLEGGDTAHTFLMSGTNGMGTPQNIERKHILGGGTPHILCWVGDTAQHLQKKLSCRWVGGGGPSKKIMPLCGSIFQAGTCQIFSLAENPMGPSVAALSVIYSTVLTWLT